MTAASGEQGAPIRRIVGPIGLGAGAEYERLMSIGFGLDSELLAVKLVR